MKSGTRPARGWSQAGLHIMPTSCRISSRQLSYEQQVCISTLDCKLENKHEIQHQLWHKVGFHIDYQICAFREQCSQVYLNIPVAHMIPKTLNYLHPLYPNDKFTSLSSILSFSTYILFFLVLAPVLYKTDKKIIFSFEFNLFYSTSIIKLLETLYRAIAIA
jgi:hypothetical protein